MGLAMQHSKGAFFPIMVCDACNKKLKTMESTIAVSAMPLGEGIVSVKVFHKGKCDPGSHFKGHEGFEEFRRYLPHLLGNHKWGERQKGKEGNNQIVIEVPPPLPF